MRPFKKAGSLFLSPFWVLSLGVASMTKGEGGAFYTLGREGGGDFGRGGREKAMGGLQE